MTTQMSADKIAAAQDLKKRLVQTLGDNVIDEAVDPLANRVRQLALSLKQEIESGALSLDDLKMLANEIALEAGWSRIERFKAARSTLTPDMDAIAATCLAPFEGRPFEDVQSALESARAGVVFTGHPTFANPKALRDLMARAASDADSIDQQTFCDEARKGKQGGHGADGREISLFDEHVEVLDAIERAYGAMRSFNAAVLRWVKSHYPDQWTDITPNAISLATWVGYDLDGRTDIHWAQTFTIRLTEKARQLRHYADTLARIDIGAFSNDQARLVDRFTAAAALSEKQAALFAEDLQDPKNVVAAANALTEDSPAKITSLAPSIEEISGLIERVESEEARLELILIKAEMAQCGLGVARIHLRINAAQVRSTLRDDLRLVRDQGFLDRTTLTAAAQAASAIDEANAVKVNFASVFSESMTARRQLMLCAQFLKHVDGETPIRFLIAECEAPATIMGAIYLAKLYGVDQHIDISPLFETPEALEGGGRFMERLLDEPEFVAYAKTRGRIAIQLGFSDSGRFMGQIAADMAIERIHVLLAREMAKRNIKGVEALMFNTHGESMGRGGYPGSLNDRFDHLCTPWVRKRFSDAGIPISAESSFQGGDGFMHFGTQELANSTIADLAIWAFQPVPAEISDQFYEDINFTWDIYRGVKSWQEDLFSSQDYQNALSAFAPNILLKTGSRKTRRQSGASMSDIARSLRAIPHNAILQQLAAPANIFGGLGTVGRRDPDRYSELLDQSERFSALIGMAKSARRLTSLAILRAYGDIYDPAVWTILARKAKTAKAAAALDLVASRTTELSLDVSLSRLANHISIDRREFDCLKQNYADWRNEGDAALTMEYLSKDLYVLHSIRLAIMAIAIQTIAELPPFSGRHELTHSDLIDRALSMQLNDVADIIAEIFPVSDQAAGDLSGISEETDAPERGGAQEGAGYQRIQSEVVAPLRDYAAFINEIGAGIAHFYGAYG